MASRVKEVICNGVIIGEKESLFFHHYKDVKHGFWDYLEEEDRYVKELVDTKKVKVDVRLNGTVSFDVTVKTRKKYTFEDLEKIGRAIVKAIWNWETVIDTVRDDNYHRRFVCEYLDDSKPIKYLVEDNFRAWQTCDGIKMDINGYREAINRGDFWQFFPKYDSHYKKLLDENIMGLSVEVFDNYRYRITTWLNNYNGLVRFFLDHYPDREITDGYVIRNFGDLAFLVKDAIRTWNWKLNSNILTNKSA